MTACDNRGIEKKTEQLFHAVGMVDYDVILGFPWLREMNPMVDWIACTWAYRKGRIGDDVVVICEEKVNKALRKGQKIYLAYVTFDPSSTSISGLGVAVTTVGEKGIPKHYQNFEDVFSEAQAGVIADNGDHDHAIDLQPGRQPPCKPIYNLSATELKILRNTSSQPLIRVGFDPQRAPQAPQSSLFQRKTAPCACVSITGG